MLILLLFLFIKKIQIIKKNKNGKKVDLKNKIVFTILKLSKNFDVFSKFVSKDPQIKVKKTTKINFNKLSFS